jgi:hypothetical protein
MWFSTLLTLATLAVEPPGAEPQTAPADDPDVDARVVQAEELVRNSQPTVLLGGYIDIGFFVPQGTGAGYIQDFGHVVFPEYDPTTSMNPYGWVFLGDILAPAVNSRGEVADLGEGTGALRYDSINSRGAPGFVANEVNLRLRSALTPTALASASLNFTPRTGNDFALGDSFDVDIAQLEWLPTASHRTSIFVGKVDSVIGIEYRERKSDRRFGITPTLLARYTTGTAVGLKVRTKFGYNDWLVLAAALTNGSFTTEQFHFYDEVDSNAGKTGSARASVRFPFNSARFELEVGMSGSYGPQDRAIDNAHPMWFFGPDAIGRIGPVEIKAQWLRGAAAGQAAGGVYGLQLNGGAYLEVDTMVTPSFGLLGRGEYRDALVFLESRLYITKSWRATVGARWVITPRALLKAELLHNGEYGRIPSVPNDVFTSSLVLIF